MADIANELTNSLSRSGQGGLLAPLLFADGTVVAPSITFTAEPTLGIYRGTNNSLNIVGAGGQIARFTPTNQLELWRNDQWERVSKGSDIDATVPQNPVVGSIWWDSQTGRSYIYYENNDQSRSQWVQMEAVNAILGISQLDFPDPDITSEYNAPNGVKYIYDDDVNRTRWDIDLTTLTAVFTQYEYTAAYRDPCAGEYFDWLHPKSRH